MKAVLINIRPQWCELITTGKKTLEIRKTTGVFVYCPNCGAKMDGEREDRRV